MTGLFSGIAIAPGSTHHGLMANASLLLLVGGLAMLSLTMVLVLVQSILPEPAARRRARLPPPRSLR
ncbi:MAG: hypothetical protein ACYDBQ_04280, partial [Thermoplasmatota archaeon]